MLGAVIGDIVGSIYEFSNHRSKQFEFFGDGCFFTDDTVMTMAVASALMRHRRGDTEDFKRELVSEMQRLGRAYPGRGYGGRFAGWLEEDDPKPYNSWGNGSAMRVAPVAWFAETLEECSALAAASAEVTHNHPEGIKGAKAAAECIYLARKGASQASIREYVEENYYKLDFTIDEIRPTYRFNESCQETVPQAIEAFLESDGFEDAVRIAISVGGDSDTLADITGAIAEAYYGIPDNIFFDALDYLDDELDIIYTAFVRLCGMA